LSLGKVRHSGRYGAIGFLEWNGRCRCNVHNEIVFGAILKQIPCRHL